jgi:hypothetical protein
MFLLSRMRRMLSERVRVIRVRRRRVGLVGIFFFFKLGYII